MKRSKRDSLETKIKKALKRAIQDVISEHKHSGLPLVVWHKGKVVRIPANRLTARS